MTWDPGLKRGWHYSQIKSNPEAQWKAASIIGRVKMRFSRRNVVVKTHAGLKIISIPQSTKHNAELAVAPKNFRPGDEKFLSLSKQGKVVFDHAGHAAHHAERAHHENKHLQWNQMSPLQRFAQNIKGKK